MALWRREEEFWLDPSYPRVSTQDALDEAWRLMGDEEEEEEQERKSIVHVDVDSNSSSKNDPSILSKSNSNGSMIHSGLKKVVKQFVISPGSGFLSSLWRLGRSKKSSSKGASSSSSGAAESNESSACQDSPRQELAKSAAPCLDDVVQTETHSLVRDSAASTSSSSTTTSEANTGESSFEADSSSSSVAVATLLALEKDSPPSPVEKSTQGDGMTEKTFPLSVVSPSTPELLPAVSEKTGGAMTKVFPEVGKMEQRFLASFMKVKKRMEPKRRSTPLPIALCFPVLWV